jgi:hypothetical protein
MIWYEYMWFWPFELLERSINNIFLECTRFGCKIAWFYKVVATLRLERQFWPTIAMGLGYIQLISKLQHWYEYKFVWPFWVAREIQKQKKNWNAVGFQAKQPSFKKLLLLYGKRHFWPTTVMELKYMDGFTNLPSACVPFPHSLQMESSFCSSSSLNSSSDDNMET